MNDTVGFFVIAAAFSIIGAIIGYLVHKSRNKQDKEIKKILKDPKLLIEELKKHGKIYDTGTDDVGEEIELVSEAIGESGEEKLAFKRSPVKISPVIDKLKKKNLTKQKRVNLKKGTIGWE